ncbi:unnamed protein product [Strongylus vulgaris]|uniref:Uncharacterized protein n=1 Tax=Strongylus vulgaris TaxID=40348 RepID=A0A3P7K6L6_STRVU|nr:unnamed protein product [Strongylus vulgaris]
MRTVRKKQLGIMPNAEITATAISTIELTNKYEYQYGRQNNRDARCRARPRERRLHGVGVDTQPVGVVMVNEHCLVDAWLEAVAKGSLLVGDVPLLIASVDFAQLQARESIKENFAHRQSSVLSVERGQPITVSLLCKVVPLLAIFRNETWRRCCFDAFAK